MLQPMPNWFWFTENSQLMLSMGDDWQCTTAFSAKQIVNLPSTPQYFSLKDTEWYLSLGNTLLASGANFTDAQLCHLLINATAAIQFHKPVTPKSWFFQEVESYGSHNRLARVSNELNEGIVLVLTDEGNMATCMLITRAFCLSDKKAIEKFELVKLAKNRLEPFLASQCAQLIA